MESITLWLIKAGNNVLDNKAVQYSSDLFYYFYKHGTIFCIKMYVLFELVNFYVQQNFNNASLCRNYP